jgi:hypothetical protein
MLTLSCAATGLPADRGEIAARGGTGKIAHKVAKNCQVNLGQSFALQDIAEGFPAIQPLNRLRQERRQ